MKYKLFGERTGLFVSELALGTGMFGNAAGYGATPEEARRIFDAYVNAGGNFIDTSDFYQLGQAESLLGDFIAGERSHYVVATKYSRGNAEKTSPGNVGNHRKAMREAVEASLRRLKTDYIDIYFAHFDDKFTPIEEIARGLEDLVQSGKILYTGLSNFPVWRTASFATLADIKGIAPLSGIQIEYNLLQRHPEQEYFPMAKAMGLAIMGYSPMAGGLLTGKYRKGEQGRITQIAEAPKQQRVLDLLMQTATETGFTAGQIAIAWAKSSKVFPIIGARTLEQFNAAIAANAVNLTTHQLSLLDEASQPRLMYPANIDTAVILAQQSKIELAYPV